MPLKPDKHITEEHCRFINEVAKLEPADTGDLYPYVRQAGYHGSRADNIALGRTNDYSIRSADDKAGPSDKTAGFDWISEAARLRNDHTIMYRYASRIRDAYNRRDPRLRGWREWLTYLDGKLIGYDFVGWYTRTPDSSHGMHHHLSKLRRYTTDWPSYAAMLSILVDEPLAAWQAGRSRYQESSLTEQDDDGMIMYHAIDDKGTLVTVDDTAVFAVVGGFGLRVTATPVQTLQNKLAAPPNSPAKGTGDSSPLTKAEWNALMDLFGVGGYRFNKDGTFTAVVPA